MTDVSKSQLSLYHAKCNTETACETKVRLYGLHDQRLRQYLPPQACCACSICSLATRGSNVEDRLRITATLFSFGGFNLTQTYLGMDFRLDYVFSINCSLCLLYLVRK